MKKKHVLVICCAALSPRVIAKMKNHASFANFLADNRMVTIEPSLPMVTMPVQASMLTGKPLAEHGCVSNSRLDRRTLKYDSWEQSALLLDSPMFWQTPAFKGKTVGTICMQFSYYNGANFMVTPAPPHGREAVGSSPLHTEPEELADILEGEFGEFPLKHYWGPFAGPQATEWISLATNYLILDYAPDIVMTYLPLLDYTFQREKFGSPVADHDIAVTAKVLDKIISFAHKKKYEVVLMSEYGITEVDKAVPVNRILREKGRLKVRTTRGYDLIDPWLSDAWAMVDHQIAHVYIPNQSKVEAIAKELEAVEGIDLVLNRKKQVKHKLTHPNCGDLVLVASPKTWFSYHYWVENAMMPPFARTVDIHAKLGYDPLELFFNRTTMSIETSNYSLVKGSHGRIPSSAEDRGVIIAPNSVLPAKQDSVAAESLPDIIGKLVS